MATGTTRGGSRAGRTRHLVVLTALATLSVAAILAGAPPTSHAAPPALSVDPAAVAPGQSFAVEVRGCDVATTVTGSYDGVVREAVVPDGGVVALEWAATSATSGTVTCGGETSVFEITILAPTTTTSTTSTTTPPAPTSSTTTVVSTSSSVMVLPPPPPTEPAPTTTVLVAGPTSTVLSSPPTTTLPPTSGTPPPRTTTTVASAGPLPGSNRVDDGESIEDALFDARVEVAYDEPVVELVPTELVVDLVLITPEERAEIDASTGDDAQVAVDVAYENRARLSSAVREEAAGEQVCDFQIESAVGPCASDWVTQPFGRSFRWNITPTSSGADKRLFLEIEAKVLINGELQEESFERNPTIVIDVDIHENRLVLDEVIAEAESLDVELEDDRPDAVVGSPKLVSATFVVPDGASERGVEAAMELVADGQEVDVLPVPASISDPPSVIERTWVVTPRVAGVIDLGVKVAATATVGIREGVVAEVVVPAQLLVDEPQESAPARWWASLVAIAGGLGVIIGVVLAFFKLREEIPKLFAARRAGRSGAASTDGAQPPASVASSPAEAVADGETTPPPQEPPGIDG